MKFFEQTQFNTLWTTRNTATTKHTWRWKKYSKKMECKYHHHHDHWIYQNPIHPQHMYWIFNLMKTKQSIPNMPNNLYLLHLVSSKIIPLLQFENHRIDQQSNQCFWQRIGTYSFFHRHCNTTLLKVNKFYRPHFQNPTKLQLILLGQNIWTKWNFNACMFPMIIFFLLK